MARTLDGQLGADALATLVLADRWAQRAGDGMVGADHLLLALLAPPDGPICPLLAALAVDPGALRAVGLRTGDQAPVPATRRGLGPDARTVLDEAAVEARTAGAERVDDIHLLLGLLRLPDEPAAEALRATGVTLDAVRAQARSLSRQPATALARLRATGLTLDAARRRIEILTGERAPWQEWFSERRRALDGVLAARRRLVPRRPISNRARHVGRLDAPGLAGLLSEVRPSPVFLAMLAVVAVSGVLLALGPAERLVRPLVFAFVIGGWLASVCVHEFGHAAAAYLGGDRSQASRGTLTLDPRCYTNPVLSFVLPLLFWLAGGIPLPGGAVAVETSSLRSRRWELAVHAGGPVGTLVCFLVFSLPFLAGWFEVGRLSLHFWMALAALATVEAASLVLNLLPVPPLDGFRLVSGWLPPQFVADAYRLGWVPLLVLYLVLSRHNPVSEAFWDLVWWLTGRLSIPDWLGGSGLRLLHLW